MALLLASCAGGHRLCVRGVGGAVPQAGGGDAGAVQAARARRHARRGPVSQLLAAELAAHRYDDLQWTLRSSQVLILSLKCRQL